MLRVITSLVTVLLGVSLLEASFISGIISDSLKMTPLKDVRVFINGPLKKDSTLTDSLGTFSFSIQPPTSIHQENTTFLRCNKGVITWRSNEIVNEVLVRDMLGKEVTQSKVYAASGSFEMPRGSSLYMILFKTSQRVSLYKYMQQPNGKNVLFKSNDQVLFKRTAITDYVLTIEAFPYKKKVVVISSLPSVIQVKMSTPPKAKYPIDGLNFSPYINGQNPTLGVVVPEKQVKERMALIAPYTYAVRTFSTTKGQNFSGKVARLLGLKIYAGAWINKDTVASNIELDSLIAMCKRGEVDTAIIGSETLLRKDVTPERMLALIKRFKDAVPNIPVTTADVYGSLIGNPNIVKACDFVFTNIYPYWEGYDIKYSVAMVNRVYEDLCKIDSSKKVIISETGWPSAGDKRYDAEPSLVNASFYFLNTHTWARANKIKVFYFSAMDEKWKTSEGLVGPNWGIFDTSGVLKQGMQRVFDGDSSYPNNWIDTMLVDGQGTPLISSLFVPKIGTTDKLKGKVSHVVPSKHKIVVYIKVGNGWWIKPFYDNPNTKINYDGTWSCNVTTGGYDTDATAYMVYLAPNDYTPPVSMSSFAKDKIVAQLEIVR